MRIGTTRAGGLALAAALAVGCPAVNQQKRDVDRTPITDVGTGATIMYPGQSPPVYQGAQHPRQTGQGSFGQPGAPAGGGSHITMIGGNTTEQESHISIDEKPVWWKYVTLPLAVVAAPFKYAYDAARPDPEPGPEVPRLENAPPPPPPAPQSGDHTARPRDYETRAIEQLERELDQREQAPAEDPFAAELAMLRQQQAQPVQPAPVAAAPPVQAAPNVQVAPAVQAAPPVQAAPTPPPRSPEDPSLATASGHVDRNADGRTDQWIFRERGEIVRELYDEDFDGRPDRTLRYDLATHQVSAIEEDGNLDGTFDTWTSLRDGAIVRRRSDADGDGHVDTWSFFRDGVLSRLERDSDGDGFRDRVTRYEAGHLAREDEDQDADGRVETVRYYDADERMTRLEEDTDHDGSIDLITHYKDGRLSRREILDARALIPAPSLSEHN